MTGSASRHSDRRLVVAIDVGTSQAKAVMFSASGSVLRLAHAATPTIAADDGRSEIDMADLWRLVVRLVREAVAEDGEQVAAVAVSGTSCGAFLIDAAGQPIGQGIQWNDGRAANRIAAWQADGTLDVIFRISGNVLFPGYTAAVLRHLQDEEPERLAHAATVFCCKDWIRFQMTGGGTVGERATDMSDASYMPFDIATGRFSRAIWEACGIGASWHLLPQSLLEPDAIAGCLCADAARAMGLSSGIPIIAGLTDVAAATLGAGALDHGEACTILGTSCLNTLVQAAPELDGPAVGIAARTVDGAILRSMVNTAGTMNLDWFLREIIGDGDFPALERAAAEVPVGARGMLYLPYLNTTGVLSPFVHPHARAQFFGLSVGHRRADMARAVLEGTAFAIRDCYAAMRQKPHALRLVGGGSRNDTWCAIIADCLGTPVHVMDIIEPGAWGVAMLALKAVGLTGDISSLAASIVPRATFLPDAERHARYSALFELYREVARSSHETWTMRARLLS
jgi:sugar (pentulose or hexulose) kinase